MRKSVISAAALIISAALVTMWGCTSEDNPVSGDAPVNLITLQSADYGPDSMIIYSGAATASREAARYGASVGKNAAGVAHYLDCDGIRDTAKRISGLAPVEDSTVTIQYDNPSTGFFEASCPPSQFELGDRIIVQVSLTFDPIVPLVNIPPIPITSETKRTVLRDIYIKE